MRLPRRKLVQKKEKGGRDTKRIRSWSSFRLTGTAILHQTMGVCNIRAWPSSTAWLLGDISNCAAYRRALPKRGYVLCTEAQELTSLKLTALFASVCVLFSALSCPISLCLAPTSADVNISFTLPIVPNSEMAEKLPHWHWCHSSPCRPCRSPVPLP